MNDRIARTIESLKGLSSASPVLSRVVERATDILRTMEPGDIAGQDHAVAAPIATDLWYLFYHQNLMQKYYTPTPVSGVTPPEIDFKHYDYRPYMAANLSFLSYLPGLKPLKVFTDLKTQLIPVVEGQHGVFGDLITSAKYDHNGIYWINTAFFELRIKDKSLQYPSEGSKGFKESPNNYVGYIAFPVGQLGVMEVISLFQETELSGYKFTAVDSLENYHAKPAITDLQDQYKPSLQSVPEMFPDMKDSNGNQLAGKNYCFGRHLIEFAYHKPETLGTQQNNINSDGTTAYAPVADRDVELWASNIKDYGEDIKPKLWMRYWIHKDSTLPVPGEFIGILTRPVAAPPHVWWFQDSNPFLYAGNWMETGNLTSGVVTEVTLEAARTDGGTGDLYKVKVQGCEIQIEASDYVGYSVGDRVAVLKTGSLAPATTSFSSNNQTHLKDTDSYTKTLVINGSYVIVPLTYYKLKH
jgi:hypothetical protein